jgi:hypothetical protein
VPVFDRKGGLRKLQTGCKCRLWRDARDVRAADGDDENRDFGSVRSN